MPLRNAVPLTVRAGTLTDTIDATNGPPGAMFALQNLIPSPSTPRQYVPRPAAVSIYDFADFLGPLYVEAEFTVGDVIYGFVATSLHAGQSQPFAYNYVTNTNIPISGETVNNLPFSTPSQGDWVPPTITRVGAYILFTHPGFNGAGNGYFGWLDLSGFSSTSFSGTVTTGTTITSVSPDPLAGGVSPGMTITGTDILPGTTVVSVTTNSIVISQGGTGSPGSVSLTIAGGTASAPLWASGNMNTNPLPDVPKCVNQFNGRAYYGVGAAEQFSDAGNPLQSTNASQAITFDNGIDVTAASTTPFTNLQGGIVQSLIVFQGSEAIQQITGDPTTNDLAKNLVQEGTGTLAPLSLEGTPRGLAFIAPDGLRFVSLIGTLTEVMGGNGEGVALPFINCTTPSRMAVAYSTDVLRCSVNIGGQTQQEYWFHFKLKSWSGPHTFPTSLMVSAKGTIGFIVSSVLKGASLWSSNVIPVPASVYVEDSQDITCSWMPSLLPDSEAMAENEIVLANIALGVLIETTFTITVFNEAGTSLDRVLLTPPVSGGPVWGTDTMIWGSFTWGAPGYSYAEHAIYWNNPIVFKQCTIQVTWTAAQGQTIGNLYMAYRRLNYPIQGAAPNAA